jgi:hypothetical protein
MSLTTSPRIEVAACELDMAIDDDELTFIFVRWGEAGQYLDITRDCEEGRTYLEFCDQGAGFYPDRVEISFADGTLVVQLDPTQTLGPDVQESRIHISLSRVSPDIELLHACISLLGSK